MIGCEYEYEYLTLKRFQFINITWNFLNKRLKFL